LVDIDPECRPSATQAQKELRDAHHRRLNRIRSFINQNSQELDSKILCEAKTIDPQRDFTTYNFKPFENKFKSTANVNNTTCHNITLGTQKNQKALHVSSGSWRVEDFPSDMIEERSHGSREASLEKREKEKASKTLTTFKTKASLFDLNHHDQLKKTISLLQNQESLLMRTLKNTLFENK